MRTALALHCRRPGAILALQLVPLFWKLESPTIASRRHWVGRCFSSTAFSIDFGGFFLTMGSTNAKRQPKGRNGAAHIHCRCGIDHGARTKTKKNPNVTTFPLFRTALTIKLLLVPSDGGKSETHFSSCSLGLQLYTRQEKLNLLQFGAPKEKFTTMTTNTTNRRNIYVRGRRGDDEVVRVCMCSKTNPKKAATSA